MAENKNSFVLYKDMLSTIEKLSDETAGKLFKHILKYVNDQSPTPENEIIDLVFEPIKNQLKRDLNKSNQGKNHWNWKGGISKINHLIRNSTRMKDWRDAVFERDKYTCQKCNKVGGKLNAHHIKYFSTHPHLRFDIDNGITLCKKCHINEHKKDKK